MNVVRTDYILYLQEDYFIGNYITNDMLEDIICCVVQNDLNYYKLDNYPKINNYKFDNNYLSLIPNNKRYGINLLSAIIKVEWLLKQLPKKQANAWEVESSFLNKVENYFSGYFEGCVVDTREPFNVKYGVRQGKWWPPTINYFKKNGFIIDTSGRKIFPFSKMCWLNVKSFVAHIIPTSMLRWLKKFFSIFGKKYISKM